MDTGVAMASARVGSQAFNHTQTMLGLRAAAMNHEMQGAGIRPRYARMPDGSGIAVSSLPKEVREFAREALVILGIPRLVAIVTHGKDVDAVSATKALTQLAMPQASSRMDGEGNESALPDGVVYFPLPEPLGAPPGDLTAEGMDGPPVAVVTPRPAAQRSALETLKTSLLPR